MKYNTDTAALLLLTNEAGYDPIEDWLRESIRATIEAVCEEKLDAFLGKWVTIPLFFCRAAIKVIALPTLPMVRSDWGAVSFADLTISGKETRAVVTDTAGNDVRLDDISLTQAQQILDAS